MMQDTWNTQFFRVETNEHIDRGVITGQICVLEQTNGWQAEIVKFRGHAGNNFNFIKVGRRMQKGDTCTLEFSKGIQLKIECTGECVYTCVVIGPEGKVIADTPSVITFVMGLSVNPEKWGDEIIHVLRTNRGGDSEDDEVLFFNTSGEIVESYSEPTFLKRRTS